MTAIKKTQADLVDIIVCRLESMKDILHEDFINSSQYVGTRFCVCDSLLPTNIANEINKVFPPVRKMRLMNSFRERKYTSKNFDDFDPLISFITFAFQDPKVISIVEEITGIKNQIPDSQLYAGGLSAMTFNHFLGPHIDNSHDGDRENYRTLNLLYYVSNDWSLECGGNLELWDKDVNSHHTIVSKFNRLAIMETNPKSWHSVSSVKTQEPRFCVSNYYFSPDSPTGKDYFNVTSFSARPEQKLLRGVAWADNKLRQLIRSFLPQGAGRKDIYKSRSK
jgi:Rps23 Pro-64 3,4-dihydroxylase Tpa1-like proline 4-hydroxylase